MLADSSGSFGSKPPVRLMGMRSLTWRQWRRRSPTTAVPRISAIQTCALHRTQQPLGGIQCEYVWQHPPTATAAKLSTATRGCISTLGTNRPHHAFLLRSTLKGARRWASCAWPAATLVFPAGNDKQWRLGSGVIPLFAVKAEFIRSNLVRCFRPDGLADYPASGVRPCSNAQRTSMGRPSYRSQNRARSKFRNVS